MGGRPRAEIDDAAAQIIARAPVLFVATAPSSPKGRINISPKGLDTFRIISPRKFAYLDLPGSGAETIAHLRQNGRVTIMFSAFEDPPAILRIHGSGSVAFPNQPEYTTLLQHFQGTDTANMRSIIAVDVERVTTSCGLGVPLMEFKGYRSKLTEWKQIKGLEGLLDYQARRNAVSIDGLEAVPPEVLEAQRADAAANRGRGG